MPKDSTLDGLFDSYFTPADPDDAAIDFAGYSDWCEAISLPELASERPARGYATLQEMLDAAADENACTLCGDRLDEPNALLCADCRAECIAQIEENQHVN